ncbi:hypothetical protein [Solirubrobacter deserti]|uniref:Rhomboid family intramembrane serine protease n=1 Tax=Solirubrobacter deserti TaxID=2282478 RepID=A0ABT4RJH2_9ACTN|nr:hypothetical protein [Solirubrobacter deserti]MDA0138701.1 hypothetical protein [Solirubrobacter deserti]
MAAAYFVTAAVGIVAPASAETIARGRIWLLLTSALAAQGPMPLAQVALTAAVAGLVVGRLGARAWWRAAFVGHVGSALIAYALIAFAGAERAAATPDYGVSCVLGASFGALLTVNGRVRVLGIAGTLALLPLSSGWIGLEHPLAVVLGAAVTARARAAARSPRPARKATRRPAGPRRPGR